MPAILSMSSGETVKIGSVLHGGNSALSLLRLSVSGGFFSDGLGFVFPVETVGGGGETGVGSGSDGDVGDGGGGGAGAGVRFGFAHPPITKASITKTSITNDKVKYCLRNTLQGIDFFTEGMHPVLF